MEQNYYDILEINKNASSEIIEKAYKTLVKKYHPDLQKGDQKLKYEEKIKKINEAYEILSNSEQRKTYDSNFENIEISKNEYINLINENINLKNEINYLKNNYNKIQNKIKENYNENNNYNKNNNTINNNFNNQTNKKINNNINKNYYNYYIKNLKNKKYKIKYQKLFKDFIALIITILIILITSFILWHIPFTKNYFINLYNENSAFEFIVNLIIKK